MATSDDARRLFLREVALTDDLKRRDSDPTLGLPHMLAETTTVKTYPGTPQCFYACQPVTLLGTETEGSPGLVTPTSAPFFALNLGSAVPPPGTQVVVSRVDCRWVFRYDA